MLECQASAANTLYIFEFVVQCTRLQSLNLFAVKSTLAASFPHALSILKLSRINSYW